MMKYFRWVCLLFFISTLTGCFTWMRAYRTYLQMDDFDQNFAITADDAFSVNFKDPVLHCDDFASLTKVQPSASILLDSGQSLRYWFRKVDEQGLVIRPETRFYFDLNCNSDNRLIRWTFSPLFLQMAPAEFLEISIRSIGGAKIDKVKRQLKVDTSSVKKISTDLPQKAQVLSQLGEPLEIEEEEENEIYLYHFLLDTGGVEKGYEDRTLSVIKLTFDKSSNELNKMAGRFAGLKISINYQKYVEDKPARLTQTVDHSLVVKDI